jgi:hypothetical protein
LINLGCRVLNSTSSQGIIGKKQLSEEATTITKKAFGDEQIIPI